MELETEQNCNILTPTRLAVTAFLSRSPELLNREPGGPASLGAGFLYRVLSPTRLIPNWSDLQLQLLNRGPEGPLCWVLAFSTTSCLQLVWSPTATAQSGAWGPTLLGAGFLYRILSSTDWISCALSYIIVQRPPSSCGRHNFALIQPVHGQGYNPDIPRPDALVIYTGAFPISTALPSCRSIYNIEYRAALRLRHCWMCEWDMVAIGVANVVCAG